MAEKSTDKKPNGFVRYFKGIGKFFRDGKTEIKKIIWPKPKAVFKNMGVVLLLIVIIGLFVFGLDIGLMNLLGLFMHVAN